MAPTAGGTSVPTAKATTADSNTPAAPTTQKPVAQLEEDDEFEDFPVEGQLILEATNDGHRSLALDAN